MSPHKLHAETIPQGKKPSFSKHLMRKACQTQLKKNYNNILYVVAFFTGASRRIVSSQAAFIVFKIPNVELLFWPRFPLKPSFSKHLMRKACQTWLKKKNYNNILNMQQRVYWCIKEDSHQPGRFHRFQDTECRTLVLASLPPRRDLYF